MKTKTLLGSLLCLSFGGVCLLAELPATDGGPPVPVIDMHTHVFNARDLPLAGAISAMSKAWVSQTIADVLKDALLALTAPDDLDGPFPPPAKLDANEGGGLAIRRTEKGAINAASVVVPRTLSENQRAKLRGYVGFKPEKGFQIMEAKTQSSADRALVAQALREAGFPPSESSLPEPQFKITSVGLDGYAQFVDIMTDGNLRIAYRLMTEQYPRADLFIHHMMDMEMGYDEKPQFQFDEQMQRMAKLDRRLAGPYAGRLLHFVAFDPFRREKALESAIRGLNAGAVGVKLYPPTGYRATSNAIPSRPGWFASSSRKERWDSRYKNLNNSQLDEIIDGLFRYCVSNSIPIFTHCTPQGFEADRDYGWMADPVFWGQALSKHPSLRLCFGHSGGEAYWFTDNRKSVNKDEHRRRSFGTNVVQLCLTYTNVYCEVGYLDMALEAKSAGLFTNRLASVINQKSTNGLWSLGDKLMYGTDWHMIHKVNHHEQYLAKFDQIMSQFPFDTFRRKFFSGNATRFLDLPTLTNDVRFTVEQRQSWQSLVTKAGFSSRRSPPK